MKNNRLVIIPEMIPYIIEEYDKYYSKETDMKIQDIGEILNKRFTDLFEVNYNFDESAYRKTYKNIKDGIDLSLENNFPDEEIERIAKARTKLKLESRIAKKERQEANSVINKIADNHLIKEVLLDTINKYEYSNIVELKNYKVENGEAPIYIYSDVHYGLQLDIMTNKYNEKIALQRLTKFFQFILNDIKENKYKEIYIADCADMIEGSTLRVSQLVNVSQLIIEQSLGYVDMINKLIIELQKKLKENKIKCKINFLMVSSGNHQQIRHFNGKPNEFANEDFGIIIVNMLKDKFKNYNNINFIFGDMIFIEINNYKMVFLHGHQLPKIDEMQYIKKNYGVDVDCLIRGHWHNFDVQSYNMKLNNEGYQQQYIITLPAVCGNTEYAISKGYSSSPAGLKLTIRKDGNINNFNIVNL